MRHHRHKSPVPASPLCALHGRRSGGLISAGKGTHFAKIFDLFTFFPRKRQKVTHGIFRAGGVEGRDPRLAGHLRMVLGADFSLFGRGGVVCLPPSKGGLRVFYAWRHAGNSSHPLFITSHPERSRRIYSAVAEACLLTQQSYSRPEDARGHSCQLCMYTAVAE